MSAIMRLREYAQRHHREHGTHFLFKEHHSDTRTRVACSCGWRSMWFYNAELAGVVGRNHVTKQTTGGERA